MKRSVSMYFIFWVLSTWIEDFSWRNHLWSTLRSLATWPEENVIQIRKKSSNATEVSLLFLYHACGLLPCGRNTGTCRALVKPVLCQQFLEWSTLRSTSSCGEVSLDDIEHGFLRARSDYFEALTIGWCSLCDYAVPPHCHFSGYVANNQNILCMNFDLPTVLYNWPDMYGTVIKNTKKRDTAFISFSNVSSPGNMECSDKKILYTTYQNEYL